MSGEYAAQEQTDLAALVKAAAIQVIPDATLTAFEQRAVPGEDARLVTTLTRHPGGASVQVHADRGVVHPGVRRHRGARVPPEPDSAVCGWRATGSSGDRGDGDHQKPLPHQRSRTRARMRTVCGGQPHRGRRAGRGPGKWSPDGPDWLTIGWG